MNQFSIANAAAQKQLTKAAQTLLGICSGIIADGAIHDREIQFLSTWLSENQNVTTVWPGSEIARRLQEILEDGTVTTEERASLLDTLQRISGNLFPETGAAAPSGPALPIDDDPSIFFRNMTFCFTGNFIFGTRPACERAVLKLGAMPVDGITKKLNYLVIGAFVSPDWINSTYGRKIEKAVAYQQDGADLVIVSEQQWTAALADSGR